MNSTMSGIARQVDGLLTAACPVADLGDDALRSRVVECEQAVAMLNAAQAEAMVQMGNRARVADRAEVIDSGKPMWSRQCRETFVADEIAVLLGWTKVAAGARYDTACRAGDLPVVQRAWRAGRIDARKVALITEQVMVVDSATAGTVVTGAVEFGAGRTAPQLREWRRRRVSAADPDAAEQRHRRAFADRRVMITAGEDGTSQLWALLPSVQARQIGQTLTTAAHAAGADTDEARTMDQRRLDTLVDLLLGRADPPQVNVQVIVAADTLAGHSDQPGWIPGLGPVTATEARELAGQPGGGGGRVSFHRLLTDPATGVLTDVAEKRYRPLAALDRAVRARDVTCRFPGCRRSADSAGTDLDHTVPWPAGPTCAANLAVLCRRHHRLKHTTGWAVTLGPTGVMTWTTPTGRTYQTQPWQYTHPPHDPDG
ncbi:MAG: HNH endonuclease [Actinomycetia bacterium]|nr:HNH endonuclease [Actinomycetes bacterium]